MRKLNRFLALLLITVLLGESIPAYAADSSVTVSKLSELESVLADKSYTVINLRTNESVTIKIPSGKYAEKTLNIYAANATIDNSAVFKKINVYDASAYTEKAKLNTIVIYDKKLDVNIDKGAKVFLLSCAKKRASVNIVNNGVINKLRVKSITTLDLTQNGKLKKMVVYRTSDINLHGSGTKRTIASILEDAENTSLKSSVPIRASVYDGCDITVSKGAEGSSVTVKESDITVSFANNTSLEASFTKKDGDKETVNPGKSFAVYSSGKNDPVPTAKPTSSPTPTPTPSATVTPTPTPSVSPTPTPAVSNEPLKAVQTATNGFTISGSVVNKDLKSKDIEIYYMSGDRKVSSSSIADITFESDNKAAVTLYSGFTAKKEYFIKIGDSVASFTTVSDNISDITHIELVNKEVSLNTETTLKYKFYDKNDIDLTEKVSFMIEALNYADNTPGKFYVSLKSGADKASLSGKKITFFTEGIAQVEASLVIGNNGLTPVKITSVESVIGKAPQITGVTYTIANDDGIYLAQGDTVKHTLEINDIGNNSFEAIVSFSDGTSKTLHELGYSIASGTEANVTVGSSSASGGYLLNPIKSGSAVITIKDTAGKTVHSCTIEVRPERKAQSIIVTSNKNLLNTNPAVGDSIVLTATVKDQYGDTIKNPSLSVEQDSANKTQTGTITLGSFTNGKLTIKGSDVNITGSGNTITLKVTSTANTQQNAIVSFNVKNIAYSATELYQKSARIEGKNNIDTTLSLSNDDNSSTYVSLVYSKENYFVKRELGTLLSSAPTNYSTASSLGIASGTTATFFTVTRNSIPITAAESNIKINSDNIEFIPITAGSKLTAGNYVITFYSVTAGDTKSTCTTVGSASVTVRDSEPPITYKVLTKEAYAPGSAASEILPKFYAFYLGEDKIPASCITDASMVTSPNGMTMVISVSFTIPIPNYGTLTASKILTEDNYITIIK